MRKLIFIAIILAAAWQGYTHHALRKSQEETVVETVFEDVEVEEASHTDTPAQFQCDDRQHCSQMRSCAEATFFLKNCPGVKMDGNNDGVPCEQQWCH